MSRDDPALFNDRVLRRQYPSGEWSRGQLWSRQQEIAESVVKYRDTVVYTGNMIGKDWVVGTLIPWWLWTRKDALVIVTGPSQRQLGAITWREIRRAIQGARFKLKCEISQGISAAPLRVTRPGGQMALGYSTTSVERASGHHGPNILVIVEEASGVEDETWEAVDSWGYRRMLAIGNPTRAEGRFVRLIQQAAIDKRDGLDPERAVNAIQIPSTDSPHATWEKSPFGLADLSWLQTQYRRYGKDSPWVRSHIFAEIPVVSEHALFPEAWLDGCTAVVRQPKDPRSGMTRLAIDLGEGEGANSSVLLVRDELGILEVVESSKIGLAEAASEAARLMKHWGILQGRISFDCMGFGRKFPHYLYQHGITQARPYNANGTPSDPGYTNLRTQGAFNFHYRIRPDYQPDPAKQPGYTHPPFAIPGVASWWPRLREELIAHNYELRGYSMGLIRKEDVTARLGQSPDIADALIQSFSI